jgi:hypothetical protein
MFKVAVEVFEVSAVNVSDADLEAVVAVDFWPFDGAAIVVHFGGNGVLDIADAVADICDAVFLDFNLFKFVSQFV